MTITASKEQYKLLIPEEFPPFFGGVYSTQLHPGKIHLVGFEFDGTACFRKGTAAGPNDIRRVGDGLETFSPYLNKDLEDFKIYDLGNLPVSESAQLENPALPPHKAKIQSQWQLASNAYEQLVRPSDLKDHGTKIITVGGEHSISYAPIKVALEAFEDLVLIHLDAHADLRDGFEDYHYSHASIMRRSLDHFGTGHELIQYGIRSGTREEFAWMREHKTVMTSRAEFLEKIVALAPARPIYLTLDLDYFDPAYLPGTGTPETGGEDFHSFVALMKILEHKNFVGADIVELSPDLDQSGCSTIMASKVIREIILAMEKN